MAILSANVVLVIIKTTFDQCANERFFVKVISALDVRTARLFTLMATKTNRPMRAFMLNYISKEEKRLIPSCCILHIRSFTIVHKTCLCTVFFALTNT